MIGSDFTQDANIKVFNKGDVLDTGTLIQATPYCLKFRNETEITDVTVEGIAQVSVLMTASCLRHTLSHFGETVTFTLPAHFSLC